ncbi:MULTISPECIES: DinB family protein [Rufibacter]|uniref:Putative damage-inducible protein DinB n=1 Tax=Rufibacter quisquiliarum TaxID=1549639 RepID=A0A839GG31_9BACT|nr:MULTISPECIES: DinB family protein [Rufibacter]MBA9077510.1 putative damage-inducible protein DinB [Rufibacter quisquiliarum]
MIQRPSPEEYNPYFENYLQLVPEHADVLELLQKQQQEVVQLFGRVSEGEADFAYAPGKWTVKELLGHMVDTERIMAYRALCVARGEQAPLPGFEENLYVQNGHFQERTLQSLLAEHQVVREGTLALFQNMPAQALTRVGNANGGPATARALAFIIAGHERHHFNILKERYLVKL